MANESPLGALSAATATSLGVFRGRLAVSLGVSRKQLGALHRAGVIERVLPDTYRLTAVARSHQQELRAALLWAGEGAAAAGRSAAELYRLEGVIAPMPEIVVPASSRRRSALVVVHRIEERRASMIRSVRGVPATGIEPTLVDLAARLGDEAFEIACEDARRRQLTSVPALRAYVARFGGSGRPGVVSMRRLLRELDAVHPARSTLEVKTRRLLVAGGLDQFVREFPLEWNGRTYRFDFAFPAQRTILETNGRRWHDDPTDYEHDNEKWSVPGRHGYRIVFATWDKVTRQPKDLLEELTATVTAGESRQDAR
jgi:predicted transcriptional regulator of viral defense system